MDCCRASTLNAHLLYPSSAPATSASAAATSLRSCSSAAATCRPATRAFLKQAPLLTRPCDQAGNGMRPRRHIGSAPCGGARRRPSLLNTRQISLGGAYLDLFNVAAPTYRGAVCVQGLPTLRRISSILRGNNLCREEVSPLSHKCSRQLNDIAVLKYVMAMYRSTCELQRCLAADGLVA